MSAMVSNGPARNNDWIGLYPPGAADGAFQDWWYLNGQKTAPATGQSNVTVQLPAPAATGAYQLRLFTNGYNKLATANVTVASMPVLTINDVSVVEGNSGTATALFTVTLSAASSSTVTVNYATADGSASSASDYTASSGTLTFSPSITTRTISVVVSGDTTVEPSETFFVNLSAPSNASVSDAQGVGTITTDDGTPAPSVTVNTPNVPRGGTIEVVINNGPGNANDWIGIYAPSASDYSFTDWFFLNGQKTKPATGQSTITVRFPAPNTAGTYEVRLFTNGYTKLATSSSIVVSP
jgi:hypothetical protein